MEEQTYMKEIITKEMKVQIMEAKLHKKLQGETLWLGIIEKMKPTKMPAWFKEWSETVYQKQPPQWFDRWVETDFKPLRDDVTKLKSDFAQLKIDNNLR